MDVLVIDDSQAVLAQMKWLLERDQQAVTSIFRNPLLALDEARMRAFDLVLVDYHMPEMDGAAVIRHLRGIEHYAQVPIVMITSEMSDAVRLAALDAGATDFLDKRIGRVELEVRLRNLVRLATAVRRLDDQASWLAGEVEKAVRTLRERESEIIFRLSLAVEYRDNDTGDHTWRVARYSHIMAEALGLDADLCRRVYLAAPLHDVGKVAIPDGILLKPGRLDPEEFALIRTHAAIGKHILGGSNCELIGLAAEIAESHHERWDGGGYPQGLSGEDIPLAARIVAVADVFDALTTQRPYKAAMPFDEARACIAAESGRHFDPACVAAFLSRWEDIVTVRTDASARQRDIPFRIEPWARVPFLPREVPVEPVGGPREDEAA
ncbi:HD domain-containing phosphohydrolase [Methylobacterium aquaticum]|jgi:two-component system, response regulator RpfG|uniref:Phosphohydrolase n=1 Tax=Methylobacterium aquaticum TaxID=270351 RepID=A0A0J6S786_9HYPH|nr:HD domain-containing phosphohydrolase [Methylobacterium aquaticum]KMO29569.1 phosphohydrolase [Methylobacterium aquaticum]